MYAMLSLARRYRPIAQRIAFTGSWVHRRQAHTGRHSPSDTHRRRPANALATGEQRNAVLVHVGPLGVLAHSLCSMPFTVCSLPQMPNRGTLLHMGSRLAGLTFELDWGDASTLSAGIDAVFVMENSW